MDTSEASVHDLNDRGEEMPGKVLESEEEHLVSNGGKSLNEIVNEEEQILEQQEQPGPDQLEQPAVSISQTRDHMENYLPQKV
jgi:hypothetical protein